MYDLLLKGGEIIDPSQGIHTVGSVAIQDGKIAAVMKGNVSEPKAKAKKIFNVEGKIIAPGLIDMHCHPAAGVMRLGVPPDEVGLNRGVTTLCDAGTTGAANFQTMRRFIVEPAKTDVFCFLNLCVTGLVTLPEIEEIRDEHSIDVVNSKQVVEANKDIIKGIKIRIVQSMADALGIKGIETAKKLATDLQLPLMVHLGDNRERVPNDKMDDFSRTAVSMLEKGDIMSHYLTWKPGGMILEDGTVYPELEAAQKRGVLLDCCHGPSHFSSKIARLAFEMGLTPNIISTDLALVTLPIVQSLIVVMSKMLNMGLSIDQVIEMTTINPARALGEEERRGSLKPGMCADITVIESVKGDYLFSDGGRLGMVGGDYVFIEGSSRGSVRGTVLLEPRMVFKAGEMLPACSGYCVPPVSV